MNPKNLSLILSSISILSLLTAVPILLLLFIGSGMSPTTPNSTPGEVIMAYSCPVIVILSQLLNLFFTEKKNSAITILAMGLASLAFAYTLLH